MREFDTGATRDDDTDKLDFEGYLSPNVLWAFGEYMRKHGQTPNGPRASDNWQKGMPLDAYMKSLLRHVMDLWLVHRGCVGREEDVNEILGGILFNTQGYWHESLQGRQDAVHTDS